MKLCEMCSQSLTGRRRRFCSGSCRLEWFAELGRRQTGLANPHSTGGLSETEGRTIIVCRDGSWIFYYRALMAVHIGRELRDDEIVHHVNGDPTDDRIENLRILSRAEHIEVHRADLLAGRGIKSKRLEASQ